MSTYPAGAVLFREGEVGDHAYIIERGRVEVTVRRNGEPVVIARLGAGDLVGEMALIQDDPRSATVTALDETVVAVIDRDHLGPILESANPVLKLFLRVLLHRFHESRSVARGMRAGDPRPAPDHAAYRAEVAQTVTEARRRAELQQAIDGAQFVLHYQPIVDLASERIAGYEALVRWQHPQRGLVGPLEFIDFAETHGLIEAIGGWVMEEAFHATNRLAARAGAAGRPAPFVTVNVSPRQLHDDDFIAQTTALLERSGVDPGSIKLELTESLLMQEPELAETRLGEIKSLGVRLALDDFGTGYSSLSYLHRYPFDTLKIDRSFVTTMLSSSGSMEIVRCVLGMSRGLQLDVVAEGIEGVAELEQLRELGCTFGQGYHFARPLPESEAFSLLET